MTSNADLPEAIRRQVEEAQALEQQLYGEAPEGNTEPQPEVQPEEPTAQPEVAAEPQPEPIRKEDEETYQQRYRVLQSKYDAEVPRLHAQLRDVMAQNQQLYGEFEKLKAQANAKPEPAPEPDNDAETFGEDLVDAIDRRAAKLAKDLVSQQLQPMQAYIQQLESKLGVVGEQVAESAQDRFYGELAKAVPDYEAINADQNFLNWLGEIDPVYGVPRQAALDRAANSLDAGRVAAIFQAYNVLTSKQVAAQQNQQVRKELERQVAPSASRSASQAPAGRVFTRADYEYAYDPRTIRELGGEKTLALQAEVDRAVAEGRIQW